MKSDKLILLQNKTHWLGAAEKKFLVFCLLRSGLQTFLLHSVLPLCEEVGVEQRFISGGEPRLDFGEWFFSCLDGGEPMGCGSDNLGLIMDLFEKPSPCLAPGEGLVTGVVASNDFDCEIAPGGFLETRDAGDMWPKSPAEDWDNDVGEISGEYINFIEPGTPASSLFKSSLGRDTAATGKSGLRFF